MPRSMWKGAISFGLVNIPVKLYPATQSKDVSFNLLHAECHSRLKNIRWCPVHEREVTWDEVVKGYEYAKDQYIVLTDEDLEQLPIPSKHTIEVSSVVGEDEIDPIYYEKSYYLEPDRTGVKGYALLARALEEKGLVALAHITLRTKERLCGIRVSDDGTLLVETLHAADEVRVERPGEIDDVKVSDRELAMAFSLLEELREPFEPEKYPDEHRDAILALIESKEQGAVTAPTAAEPAKVIDLMEALKASVSVAKQRREEKDEPAGAKKRRRKAS